jgi:putative DNA primase/helicase
MMALDARPTTPSTDLPAIAELAPYPQWVGWRWEERMDAKGNSKLTKPPYSPRGGHRASVTKTTDWSTYEIACKYRDDNGLAGIGFVLTAQDGYSGIDLDDCIDDDGNLTPDARAMVAMINSYTEISPSGHGLRIIARAALPSGRRKVGDYEMYDTARFVTLTGNHLPGTPTSIEERTTEVARAHALWMTPSESGGHGISTGGGASPPTPTVVDLDDAELLCRAMRASNGAAFSALWDGDLSAYASHSEGDGSLSMRLVYWCGGDTDRADRLFRLSGLYRPKWDEQHGALTYGEITLASALAKCPSFYDPHVDDPHPLNFYPSPPRPELPVETEPAPDAWRAQIIWLEAALDAAKAREQQKDEYIADLQEQLGRAHERRDNLLQVIGHPHLSKPEAVVLVITAELVEEKRRRQARIDAERDRLVAEGKAEEAAQIRDVLDARGRATIWQFLVAERTGLSVSTVRKAWNKLHARGLITKDTVDVPPSVNPRTGEIREGHKECRIALPCDDVDEFFRQVVSYHPGEDFLQRFPKQGGYHPKCPTCGNVDVTVTQVYRCAECGDVIDESHPRTLPKQTLGASSAEGTTGEGSPPVVIKMEQVARRVTRPARRARAEAILQEPIARAIAAGEGHGSNATPPPAACTVGRSIPIPAAFQSAFSDYPAPGEPEIDYSDEPPPPPPPLWAIGAVWLAALPATAPGSMLGREDF